MGNVMSAKKTAKRAPAKKAAKKSAKKAPAKKAVKKSAKKSTKKTAKKAPAKKTKGTKKNKRKMKGGFGFRFSPGVVQGASSSALANPMPYARYNNCSAN